MLERMWPPAIRRPINYVLDEHGEPEPIGWSPADTLRFARFMQDDERRIVRRQTFMFGDPELVSEPVEITVSTVFLGIDHNFVDPDGPPVLWETMVFGLSDPSEICERYSSREDAIAGHNELVGGLGGPVLE
jgi:hypothetical protein